MKEAFVDNDLSVEVRDTDKPTPGRGQLVIRTIVSGTNPKDWKTSRLFMPDIPPHNPGDDIAGFVEDVGEDVEGFKKGDRVAAFHEMLTPGGSYAEYSVAWARTTFHLPDSTSFEEAATIPLAGATAAIALYRVLDLPLPWEPTTESHPFIVYGGATAVGAFGIKMLKIANVHPIIAVAGRGIPFVRGLLDASRGDVVIDYRKGNDHVVQELRKVAGNNITHALDAVSENGSITNLGKVLAPGGIIATVLPVAIRASIEDSGAAKEVYASVGNVHMDTSVPNKVRATSDETEFGSVIYKWFGEALRKGTFSGHPHEVIEGGLYGVEKALKMLAAGEVSARKLVIRIRDTKGLK